MPYNQGCSQWHSSELLPVNRGAPSDSVWHDSHNNGCSWWLVGHWGVLPWTPVYFFENIVILNNTNLMHSSTKLSLYLRKSASICLWTFLRISRFLVEGVMSPPMLAVWRLSKSRAHRRDMDFAEEEVFECHVGHPKTGMQCRKACWE